MPSWWLVNNNLAICSKWKFFFNNHLMIMYSLQIGFFKHKINIKDFKKLDNFLNKLNYSRIFKRVEK